MKSSTSLHIQDKTKFAHYFRLGGLSQRQRLLFRGQLVSQPLPPAPAELTEPYVSVSTLAVSWRCESWPARVASSCLQASPYFVSAARKKKQTNKQSSKCNAIDFFLPTRMCNLELLMLCSRLLSYAARWNYEKHERSVRFARGIAECNLIHECSVNHPGATITR